MKLLSFLNAIRNLLFSLLMLLISGIAVAGVVHNLPVSTVDLTPILAEKADKVAPRFTGTLGYDNLSTAATSNRHINVGNQANRTDPLRHGDIFSNSTGLYYHLSGVTKKVGSGPGGGSADLTQAQNQPYTNSTSGLLATTIRTAIDELKAYFSSRIDALISAMAVTGFRPPAALSLDTTSLAFGNVSAASSRTASYTITNTGFRNLSTTTVAGSGAGIAKYSNWSTCKNKVIAVNGSCTTTVSFTPTAAGSFNGSLAIASNDPSGVKTVTLSGTGTSTTLTRSSAFAATENPLSESGSWTIPSWSAAIQSTSGYARSTTNALSVALWTGDTFSGTNQCSEVEVTDVGGFGGPVVLANPTSQTMYLVRVSNTATSLYKNNTSTVISTIANSYVAGRKSKLCATVNGSTTTLTVYYDGVLKATHNDSTANLTAGYPGIQTNYTTTHLDNWAGSSE